MAGSIKLQWSKRVWTRHTRQSRASNHFYGNEHHTFSMSRCAKPANPVLSCQAANAKTYAQKQDVTILWWWFWHQITAQKVTVKVLLRISINEGMLKKMWENLLDSKKCQKEYFCTGKKKRIWPFLKNVMSRTPIVSFLMRAMLQLRFKHCSKISVFHWIPIFDT